MGRYGYDSEGLRILKIGDDGIRRYSYDQLSVITESSEINATVSKYDYGLDQLVSLDNTSEGRSFFHLDFLGSTANLTNAVGGTRQSTLYDAWGNERERVGASENNFTFTGHEKDQETGLIYAKARFYDPDVGRFLTQDSYLGNASTAPSLHRYSYAYQNPIRYWDPTGFATVATEDMGVVRKDVSDYWVEDDGERIVRRLDHVNSQGWTVRKDERPSQFVNYLIQRYGNRQNALDAIDEMRANGIGTFALVILEDKELSDDGVNHEEVYGDFIKEVGSWSLAIEGLQDEVSRVVAGGSRKNRVHDISVAYNVAYDYSSAAAHAFAKRHSSETFFIRSIQRTASLLGQGLYKTAPADFRLTYGASLLLETVNAATLGLGVYRLGSLGFQAVKAARTGATASADDLAGALSHAQVESKIANRTATRAEWRAYSRAKRLRTRVNSAGGTENCVNCALAGDRTLGGQPGTAALSEARSITVLEREFGNRFANMSSPEAIEQAMLSAGPGARGVVFGRVPGRAGHVFNAVNENGAIVFYDIQQGTLASFDGYIGWKLLMTH